MAHYKNMNRLREISESLPRMEKGRRMMADSESFVAVVRQDEAGTRVTDAAELPREVKMNIVNVLNAEINRQREELEKL